MRNLAELPRQRDYWWRINASQRASRDQEHSQHLGGPHYPAERDPHLFRANLMYPSSHLPHYRTSPLTGNMGRVKKFSSLLTSALC